MTEQYAYDADNARVKKTRGNTTSYYYGGLYEVEKGQGSYPGTSSVTRYYYGFAGGVAAQREVVSSGLRAEYFDNSDFTSHKLTRYDNQVDFTWADGASPDPTIEADTFSVRWQGKVRATKTGTYEFVTVSDDGVRLWVNGQLLIDNWTDHGPTTDTGTIYLTGGQDYALKLKWDYPDKVDTALLGLDSKYLFSNSSGLM